MPNDIKQIENVGGFVIEQNDERLTFVNDPDTNNDIQKSTIIRLGQYLSDVTKANIGASTHANEYSIETEENVVASLTNEKGFPIKISNSKNKQLFLQDRQNLTNVSLDRTLREPSPTTIGLDETWKKGISEKELPDGNSLLKNATANNSPVKPIVSAVLNNNRFTTDSQMNVDFESPSPRYNPSIRIPTHNKNSLGTHNTIDTFLDDSFDKLALVGHILSLRGSGEVGSQNDNYNPMSAGSEAKAFLPSLNQLAVERINPTTFEAQDVYNKMANVTIADANIISIADGSWGAMNNVYDPFSGMTALAMPVLAATLTIAVLTVVELLGGVASLVSGKPVNAPTKHSDGRYVLGKWSTELKAASTSGPTLSFNFPPSIQDVLGIRETEYPFMTALNKGMFLFFGMDTSGGTLSALLGGIDQAIETPGYNAVVCRSILRSTLTITDQIKHTFSSPNFISGVKNVMAVLEIVKRSKVMAAINIFTTLGDRALAEIEGANEIDRDGIKINSEIDSFDNNVAGAAVKKSKLNGINKLAWANNRTPSMFLMPSTVMGLSIASAGNSDNQLGGSLQQSLRAEVHSKNETIIKSPDDKSSIGSGMRIQQISNDPDELTVDSIEKMLDAEYVPFYFHDLRTNEIVSFQSFLTALTEDYSPQWESSEGYGRVDKIKIYKSTDRRINVGFWAISTSQNDFDDLWVKINKLVTLVYPQYSAGRKLSPQGYNFTMPFSQIITSSPIIRLRIGDLIRSNYSKFNLARLFGLADYDSPMLNNNKLAFETNFKSFLEIKDTYEMFMKRPWEADKKYKWYLTGPDGMNMPDSGMAINIPIPLIGGGGEAAGKPFQIPTALLPYYNVKPIKKYESGGQGGININISISSFGGKKSSNAEDENIEIGVFELSPMSADEITRNWNMNIQQAQKIASQLDQYETNGKNRQKTKGRQFILPANTVKMQEVSLRQFWLDNNASVQSGMDSVLEFMSAKNNAIVRAFQETSGKGLAGTIDSLSFDWNEGVTWEIDPHRKAPTRVKVTFTFSPIHDISPGIDHLGLNRSPLYPVGPMFSEIVREKL
jgi:hypothetical protein